MALWFRFFLTLIIASRRSKLGVLDTSVKKMHVWWTDVDVARMDNGRYLTLMDLGRVDLMLRQGLFFKALFSRNFPLVAAQFIQYKKSLRVFQSYELHTRFVYWDQKWAYAEQTFVQNGEVVANAFVKGLFRGPKGNLPIEEMFRLGGFDKVSSPPAPAWIQNFDSLQAKKNRV